MLNLELSIFSDLLDFLSDIVDFFGRKADVFFDLFHLTKYDAIIFIAMLLSVACAIGLYQGLFSRLAKAINRKSKNHRASNVRIILCIFLAILFVKFAIEVFAATGGAEDAHISFHRMFELAMASIVRTLQSFSLDEDYAESLKTGKAMMSHLANAESVQWIKNAESVFLAFFPIHFATLSIFAPIAGGAIIIDLVAGIFPKLRLSFIKLHPLKTKYIFSELNERSLALAENIIDHESKLIRRPIIVFTDAYLDDEQEKSSELYQSAKNIGAIVVADDIVKLNVKGVNKKVFILIDENEENNALMLSKFASKEYFPLLSHKSKVLVFYKDDSLTYMQYSAYENMKRLTNDTGNNVKDMPEVQRINCYQEIVFDVLHDYPLYYPLRNKKGRKKELKVTIIGAGSTGKEMFLASSWAGQMLDVELHLNVVSLEEKVDFLGAIDTVNPEILRSANPKSSLLDIYSKDVAVSDEERKAEPYFNFGYKKMNAETTLPEDVVFDNGDELLDSDYVFICLGEDEMNIRIADKLNRAKQISEDREQQMRIIYVVFNSEICGMLNHSSNIDEIKKYEENPKKYEQELEAEKKKFEALDKNNYWFKSPKSKKKRIECKSKIERMQSVLDKDYKAFQKAYMTAVGDLSTVFSFENIFDEDNLQLAKEVYRHTYEIYSKTNASVNASALKEQYGYWSNISRTIHLPYRIFSALDITGSSTIVDEELTPKVLEEYFSLLEMDKKDCSSTLSGDLIWLEHRRWNAYLRSQGYRTIGKEFEKNFTTKIHPCIVEMKKPTAASNNFMDKLDEVSAFQAKKLNDPNLDYKIYDNPYLFDYDYNEYAKRYNKDIILDFYKQRINK